MRIISGRARGVRLKTPDESLPVRPTGDRVKEAMFSAIQFDIKGEVLDLLRERGNSGLKHFREERNIACFATMRRLPAQ